MYYMNLVTVLCLLATFATMAYYLNIHGFAPRPTVACIPVVLYFQYNLYLAIARGQTIYIHVHDSKQF